MEPQRITPEEVKRRLDSGKAVVPMEKKSIKPDRVQADRGLTR